MELEVKLYPQVGRHRFHLGDKEEVFDTDLGQCIVHANGKMVGIYCGKQNEANKYLSFTVPLPDKIQGEIATKVATITGGVLKYNAPPPDEHEVVNDEPE